MLANKSYKPIAGNALKGWNSPEILPLLFSQESRAEIYPNIH